MADTASTTPHAVPVIDPRSLENIGSSGLNRAGGYVYEELHPKLTGQKAVRVYRQMADNDAVVGSILYAFESLVRQVPWRVEPADDSPAAKEVAEFLEGCLEDMSHTWEDHISEALSELVFGWAYTELVYKLRRGNDADPRFRSRFNDGRYGWRKIALRSQETWQEWDFDEEGGVRGLWQAAPPDYRRVYLPMSKGVLYRTKAHKNNPEGRSLLRTAYRAWRLMTRMQDIESVGIERDLSGLPTMQVPPELLSENATPEQQQLLALFTSMVQKVRRDEREGVVVPAEELTDPETGLIVKTGYKFSLLTTGGRRAIDVRPSIEGYQHDIARTLLADFIFLGTNPNGSRSLADNKTDLFAAALGGYLDAIEATFHLQATSRLMELNNVPRDYWPRLVHGDVETPELNPIADFIQKLVTAGVLVPDSKLERHLRELARLPQVDPGAVDDRPLPTNDTPATVPPSVPDAPPAGAPAAPAQPAVEAVADTALNGAQVTSLKEVLVAAKTGELPVDTVRAMMQVAFPTIDPTRADAMLTPILAAGIKEPPAPPPPFGAPAQVEKAAPKKVAVVCAYDRSGLMLWGKRRDDGLWTTPAGHFANASEPPVLAAVRELFEESGLMPDVTPLAVAVERAGPVEVHVFRAEVHGQATSAYDPDMEVSEWRWVNVSGGLPSELRNALHVPEAYNVLARAVPELFPPR